MALPDITFIRTRFNLLHAKREFDSEDYNNLDKVLRFAQVAAAHLPKLLELTEGLDDYYDLDPILSPIEADKVRDAITELRNVMK